MTSAAAQSVRRVDFGWFVRPGSETASGAPRVEPCLGYVVASGRSLVLFDTGMGSHPEVDAHYRPTRHCLEDALAPLGIAPTDVTHVVNCHLHFDHCGGNPVLSRQPTFVQRVELAQARGTVDYTLPELLDASRFVELDGIAEILPGVVVLPTPGHTDGHQSLVVTEADGTVVVAGQSHDSASDYAADVLSLQPRRAGYADPLPLAPAWVDYLQSLDPRRVVFAHDHSVWVP